MSALTGPRWVSRVDTVIPAKRHEKPGWRILPISGRGGRSGRACASWHRCRPSVACPAHCSARFMLARVEAGKRGGLAGLVESGSLAISRVHPL